MRFRSTVAILALLASVACSPNPFGANNQGSPEEVHERLLTMDTHLDTPTHFERPGWSIADRHDYATDISQVDLPRMVEGGLDGGFFVIYTPQGPLTAQGFREAFIAADLRQQEILEMVSANGDAFELALRSEDAERITAEGRRFVFQSIENSYPLGDNISALEHFHARGVRMAGPVHSRTNQFADSTTGEETWNGLSPAGRALITEMNRLGIIVDASHASDAAFDQILEQSATPIILSHSGPRTAFDHPRNINDERIRRLAEAGGVIAVNSIFLAPLVSTPERDALDERLSQINDLSPAQQVALVAELRELDAREPYTESNFEMFMASLLHLLEIAGVDHVAFGADWDGGGGVEGMRDVAALPLITARLIEEGYSEDDLAKIWGGNVLRLMRAAEAHSDSLRS
jgi:membrane dipeptidase